MRLRKLLLLAIVFIAGISQAQMQMPPIPLDSAVRIGKLDNGLTYYIRYNNWPEHRANFYICLLYTSLFINMLSYIFVDGHVCLLFSILMVDDGFYCKSVRVESKACYHSQACARNI